MKKLKIILLLLPFLTLLSGCYISESKKQIEQPKVSNTLTEKQARKIAESICIKGGESLYPGYYNENTKTWWFDANLNATKEGCHPACVVSEDTKTAEINWRCTGLVEAKTSAADEIKQLFIEKYPKYTETLVVNIEQETENHCRGGVTFETGAPGGNFLATKINNVWKIVYDGNGVIPCSLSEYEFPESMLNDCAKSN